MTGPRFTGKVAVVTGAGSGIGAATARLLGEEGAAVACVDVAADVAQATANAIVAAGGRATGVACDISDVGSVDAAVTAVLDWGGRLDVLANVAGIGHSAPFAETTPQDWARILGVNLTGTYLVTHRCMDALVATTGAVVNVGSLAGIGGIANMTAYCASKGGVVLFSRVLAREYGPTGVRVNCVCPGAVDTALTEKLHGGNPRPATSPLQRRAQPEEIATAIAFLASDDAGYATGSVLVVDGGSAA